MFNRVDYGFVLNRFPGLFGDKPEATIVPDRLFNAIAAATRFDGVAALLRSCQHDHYLLQVIQCEVLRDASRFAFTKQVDVLKADHEKRIVPELQAAYRARLAELEPLLERWRGLEATCKAAVNDTYTAESAEWRRLREERDRVVSGLEMSLAIAQAFAAESGLPLSEDDAQLAARIAEAEAQHELARGAAVTERERVVTELKRQCEADKRPLWVEYDREQTAAKRQLDEAVSQAGRDLRQRIEDLRRKFEEALASAEAQVNAQYGALNEGEQQLQAAVAAFAAQMKTTRTESAQAVSAGITALYAIKAVEEPTPAAAEPAAVEAPPAGE